MQLFAFGINHQTAPLAVREQVVFHAERCSEALRDLVDQRPVKEAAILSTCNRTEVYCNTRGAARGDATGWPSYHQREAAASSSPTSTRCRGNRRCKHAFRVASGLDSMVLGEPQILGQMKQAVRTRRGGGHAGHCCCTSCSSARSRWRRRCARETEIGASFGVDGGGGGEARRAHLPAHLRAEACCSSAPAR